MQFVLVFGINYYFIPDVAPDFAVYWLNWATGKFGFDLDNGAPACIRHKANFLLKKFGSLNF